MRVRTMAIAGAALVVASSALVSAQSGPARSGAPDNHARVEAGATCDAMNWVALDGRVVLRVRTPGTLESCLERRGIIHDRLVVALSEPAGAGDVRVMQSAGVWGVYIKDRLIATADDEDARINRTSSRKLADVWARNLRSTFPQALPWAYHQQYLAQQQGREPMHRRVATVR